ncbi:M20 family metallopeptidase [Lacrimispora sp.]|uniref:M20 family metallopeptidase n=1 Tax=Lacrimispora sp. TaxID=2719234 RepID=UPI002FD96982
MNAKERIIELIEQKEELFTSISDGIWEFAETRFALKKSADLLCDAIEKEGFQVTRDIAGMKDAFIAEYGSGSPVIGILAEYDALNNMSQQCDVAEPLPIKAGESGHGCGHHLLGAGAFAGAAGIKDYMKETGMTGTIRLFGCPAEESGYGKAFMARDGVFEGTDAALTWHPMDSTGMWDFSSLAVFQTYFRFKGRAAHAAAAPEHGRSALDAAELMNIGVNFLREHIIDEGRIHYAFTDVGGTSANVVQPTAELYYFVRAPKAEQAREIYDRVVRIAKGAAMMTDTEVEIDFDSACASYMVNRELGKVMYENLKQVTPLSYTEEEMEYARKFFDQLPESTKNQIARKISGFLPDADQDTIDQEAQSPINRLVAPLTFPSKPMSGSTDVGDVSWTIPTATAVLTTAPNGTPAHSWQWVATGKSTMAHKGMMAAGKVIAMTALDLLENPEIIRKAKEEHNRNLGGKPFVSAIPPEISPR